MNSINLLIFFFLLASNIFASDISKKRPLDNPGVSGPNKQPKVEEEVKSAESTFDLSTLSEEKQVKLKNRYRLAKEIMAPSDTMFNYLRVELPIFRITNLLTKEKFLLPDELADFPAELEPGYFPMRQNYWAHDAEYPKHWTSKQAPNDSNPKAVLVNLNENDPEYKTVKMLIPKGKLSRIVVHSIKRIENHFLWNAFVEKWKLLHKTKHASPENSKYLDSYFLFHGTRGTKPEVIYDGEDGFDWREAGATSYYGKGIYFSASLDYAKGYAHRTEWGTKQVFLSLVLPGQVKNYDEKKEPSLKRPPLIIPDNLAGGKYDSTSGIPKTPRMYTIYDNHQAYPAYIIDFSDKADSVATIILGPKFESDSREFYWSFVAMFISGWKSRAGIEDFSGWPVFDSGIDSLVYYMRHIYLNTYPHQHLFVQKMNDLGSLLGKIQTSYNTAQYNNAQLCDFLEIAAQAMLDPDAQAIDKLNELFKIIPDLIQRKPAEIKMVDFIQSLTFYKITPETEASMLRSFPELTNNKKLNELYSTNSKNLDFQQERNIVLLKFQLSEHSKKYIIGQERVLPELKLEIEQHLIREFYKKVIDNYKKLLGDQQEEESKQAPDAAGETGLIDLFDRLPPYELPDDWQDGISGL